MKYINIKIPKPFIIIMLLVLVLYYVYGAYKFEMRVQAYNKKINVGDPLIMVLALMGKPSHYDDLYYFKQGNEQKRSIILIYLGALYLRDSIILIFDYETERLLKKERIGFVYRGIEK